MFNPIKRIIPAVMALISLLTAYAQDDFSREITYLSGKDNYITVQVAVQAQDKKELEALACKSVIDTYLFYGIDGIGTGAPVIGTDVMDLHPDYFRSLYDRRYTVYANSPKKVSGPKKNTAGLHEAVYNILFKQKSFHSDLILNKIIPGETTPPPALPTIMVVPFRRDGQSYRYILDNNPYIRTAISKVQEVFSEAKYTTVDFIAKLEAAERHNNFLQDNADSFSAQLIRSSGSDIYVSVDCTFAENYDGNHVALSLKAYYTSTGNITASETSSFTGDLPFDRCCVGAVHRAKTDFMKQIKWPPSKTEAHLAVNVDSESMLTLESVIGHQGATIAEDIRAWIKANAKAFHQKGLSETEIIFDSITLPDDCDATDFAIKLAQNLRRQGVSAKYTIDGLSIYIIVSN